MNEMFWAKSFKKPEITIRFICDLDDWAIIGRVGWLYITRKKMPELRKNLFTFGFQILCFELKIEYWWDKE